MSTPSTKRDQRRETRKSQQLRLQEERRVARERARRMQLTRRYGFIGGGILVVVILALVIAHFVSAAGGPQSATGDPVDNISCVPTEGQVQHFHDQLYIYVNGQQVTVPQYVGIVPSQGCLYSLHTHDSSGIMHIESNSPNQTYTLGNFFDIWGQSLTSSNFMGNKIDSSHKLEIRVYDAKGTAGTYTGVPGQLPLSTHLTIYLLYNSPNVQTAPFTQWNGL